MAPLDDRGTAGGPATRRRVWRPSLCEVEGRPLAACVADRARPTARQPRGPARREHRARLDRSAVRTADHRGQGAASRIDGRQRAGDLLPARHGRRSPGATPRRCSAAVAVAGRRVELRPESTGSALLIPRIARSDLGTERIPPRDQRSRRSQGRAARR